MGIFKYTITQGRKSSSVYSFNIGRYATEICLSEKRGFIKYIRVIVCSLYNIQYRSPTVVKVRYEKIPGAGFNKRLHNAEVHLLNAIQKIQTNKYYDF